MVKFPTPPIVVCAFYEFVALAELPELQRRLCAVLHAHRARGTILLAAEGINGSIAADRTGVNGVLKWLRRQPGLAALVHKESFAYQPPFQHTKVKIKKEIVTMGVDNLAVDARGEYVAPQDWNALLVDKNTVAVDARNAYETNLGSFANAIPARTDNFREFPEFAKRELTPHREKNIAMFCTGGIRCEKASAYLKQHGFAKVFQLHGGILNYLATVPAAESKWQGECFVFDERVTVDKQLRAPEKNK